MFLIIILNNELNLDSEIDVINHSPGLFLTAYKILIPVAGTFKYRMHLHVDIHV